MGTRWVQGGYKIGMRGMDRGYKGLRGWHEDTRWVEVV